MQTIRHGEVILSPQATLPKEAELLEESGKYVVAHSETGHHHILEAKNMSKIKVWAWKDERYIEVPEMAELWHQKTGKDVHTPHNVAAGIYKINLKKEFDYFKGAIRLVRD